MIRDIDRNHLPTDGGNDSNGPLNKEDAFIQRIDQARGVIALAAYALAWDCGVYSALATSALDLANDELQRLREEIDAGRLEVREGEQPAG